MERYWLKEYPVGVMEKINIVGYDCVTDILDTTCRKFGHRPAFANLGTELTYATIEQKSRAFSSYLQQSLRLKKGARVAIMLPNILQYPIALYGILRAGLVVVNVNPLYTPRELRHQLLDSGAEAIIILENFAHVLAQIIKDTAIKYVVTTEVGEMLKFPKSKIVNFVLRYFKKAIPAWNIPQTQKFKLALKEGAAKSFMNPEVKPDDIAFLQYTGGTTGVAKGAILTHKNIISNVMQAKSWVGGAFQEGIEIAITALPLYHIFSLTANCLYFCALGGLNVLITNPRDMPAFIKELKNWNFSYITGVNTLFAELMTSKGFGQIDFSYLKIALSGGMAVTQEVAKNWKKSTGKVLLEAYGLSETSPAVCINPVSMEDYNGCIGLPISSTQVQIVDDQEVVVPTNNSGELCVKGPQVTQGYWQQPEETKKLFTKDGWLKTGDIATMDERGYIRILDRKKDMIIVSGFNVFPNEIEDVLEMHAGIMEAAAVSIPDEKSGEAVKVFIVRSDPTLTKRSIKEHCRTNLTSYKRPKEIIFINELPKTNVGKIMRRKLREV